MNFLLLLNIIYVSIEFTSGKRECSCELIKQCIQKFDSSIEIVTKDNTSFEQYNYQHCPRKIITPEAYIVVKNTEDVQVAVKCLTQLKCLFAIKAGGGSYENYSSGGKGHFVITLKQIKNIKFDSQTMTAEIGAGNTAGDVINNLIRKHNVAITLGIASHVGFSGLALGGGWGFFARNRGLTVQSIVEMTVVDANGNILIANSNTNSDLFAALRGAGASNYGIVTNFKVKVFNASHTVTTVEMFTNLNYFEHIFEQFQYFLKNGDKSINFVFFVMKDMVGIHAVIDNEDEDIRLELSEQIQALFRVPDMHVVVNNYKIIDFLDSLEKYLEDDPLMIKAKSSFVDRYLSKDEIKKLKHIVLDSTQKFDNLLFEFMPMGGTITESNVHSSYIHNNNLFLMDINTLVSKKNVTFDTIVITETNTAYEKSRFMHSGYSYQNTIDEEQDISKYYGHKLSFLMHTKSKIKKMGLKRKQGKSDLSQKYVCLNHKEFESVTNNYR
ncbi:hypothetical protein B4U80_13057 [Leptotrombidium deliense]|uniref:FAD-binding PCMH-type domain-containing protein n=1 Tax=Leptotrombidium deliense TaxID=299467 RepID=A0A443SDS9_9ACAR|nr:hypothetical protein B4U80_13057 [Leptotrombidium deliense]